MRLRSGSSLAGIAVIALGAALAFALPAGAAATVQAQSPPKAVVALAPTATLEANGAAVFTASSVRCQPGAYYVYLIVTVTQAVDGKITRGEASRDLDICDNKPHALKIAITASTYPFIRDVAFGQAVVTWCGTAYPCKTYRDERTIRIV